MLHELKIFVRNIFSRMRKWSIELRLSVNLQSRGSPFTLVDTVSSNSNWYIHCIGPSWSPGQPPLPLVAHFPSSNCNVTSQVDSAKQPRDFSSILSLAGKPRALINDYVIQLTRTLPLVTPRERWGGYCSCSILDLCSPWDLQTNKPRAIGWRLSFARRN